MANPEIGGLPHPTTVSKLPLEVLTMIFDCLHDGHCRPLCRCSPLLNRIAYVRGLEDWNFPSLLMVCRAWRTIAEPILYRCIRLDLNLEIHKTEDVGRYHQLLQNFQRRPELCSHVRHLRISGRKSFRITKLLPILRQRENLPESERLLLLQNWVDAEAEACFWLYMLLSKHVERLHVSLLEPNILFGDFFQHLDKTSLRSLTLKLRDYDSYERLPIHPNFTLAPRQSFSANLKSIEILHYDVHIDALHMLFTWPVALESFRLLLDNPEHGTHHWQSYDASSVQKLLNLQSHSLQKIQLPMLFHENCLPKFATFEKLTELQLPCFALLDDAPSMVHTKLATPALKFLTVETNLYDPTVSVHRMFDKRCAEWFIDFIHYRTQCSSENNLRGIHIAYPVHIKDIFWRYFNIDGSEGGVWGHDVYEFPYLHLNVTKIELAKFNVNLTYTEPQWTREEWDLDQEQLRRQREEEAAEDGA